MNIKKAAWLTAKILVVVAAWLYVAHELLGADLASMLRPVDLGATSLILGCSLLALVFVNWTIESFKWMIALHGIAQLRFREAFASILAGTTLGIISPNRVGEFFGRQLHVPGEKRAPGIAAALGCSLAQLTITIVAGCLALPLFLPQPSLHIPEIARWLLTVASITAATGTLFLFFKVRSVVPVLRRLPFSRYFEGIVAHLENVPTERSRQLLRLSLWRYTVFLVQFFLAFQLCDVRISLVDSSVAVALIYVTNALVPTTTLLELGIRCGASVFFAGTFTHQAPQILEASILVWICNLALPAAAGSLVILFGRERHV